MARLDRWLPRLLGEQATHLPPPGFSFTGDDEAPGSPGRSPPGRRFDSAERCRGSGATAAAGAASKSLVQALARAPEGGAADTHRHTEVTPQVWADGEWKGLSQAENEEIARFQAAGETKFYLACRGVGHPLGQRVHLDQADLRHRVDLRQMELTCAGRSQYLRFVGGNAASCSRFGFDAFRKTFREYAGNSKSMNLARLTRAWPCMTGQQETQLVRASARTMLQEMTLRMRPDDVSLVEWNHYWALDRDSPSFPASVDVNQQLSHALMEDPQVLSRLQAHFEAGLSSASTSGGGLSTADLMKVCERLVQSSNKLPERQWATEVIRKHRDGEVFGELNYYDFLNVMLGRRRFKVSLWMYDITEGLASRWSWLVLGQEFEGIWHTGVVVDYPGRPAEFWFGGNLFISAPGATPFGSPKKKVDLGYTFKTREEVRNHMARHLALHFTRANYDIIKQNCNHFSDRLVMYLLNERLPDEVMAQPQKVMTSMAAQAVRPLLNKWLSGFGVGIACDEQKGGDAAKAKVPTSAGLASEVLPGAVVEFRPSECDRVMIGVVLDCGFDDCTVKCLDFSSRSSAKWSVPSTSFLRVLHAAPLDDYTKELGQPGVREEAVDMAAVSGCTWPLLPCLLGSGPPPAKVKEVVVHPQQRVARRIP